MLLKQDSGDRMRPIAFALGGLVALFSFAVFAWGLTHYWNPSSPHPAPPFLRYFRYVWLADPVLRIWKRHGKPEQDRPRQEGWWPLRNPYPAPPEPENQGATETHASEAAYGRKI